MAEHEDKCTTIEVYADFNPIRISTVASLWWCFQRLCFVASSSPSDDDAYCCVRQIANPPTQSSSPLQSNCNLFCLGGVLNHNEYFIPSKVGGYKEQYLKGGTDFQKSPRWWHPLKLDLGHHLGDWCKKQIERTTPILPGGGKNWWLQYGSKGLDPVEWWDDGFQLASTGVANKKTWVPKNSDIAYTKKAFCQFPQWKHRNRKWSWGIKWF